MLQKIENSIKNRVRKTNNKSVRSEKYIILTNNCLAGFLYHDYHLQFNSPTINLQLMPEDFVNFCNKLEYYLAQDLIEVIQKPKEYYYLFAAHNFPVGKLGDLTIYFQHYSDFAQAKMAWERRKKRTIELLEKGNQPYVILVSKILDKNVENKFKKLDFKNKIILSAERENDECVFNLPGWSKRDWWEYRNWYSLKRNYEDFDFRDWLKLS